mgnify:CR=1 FL=1
MLNIDTAIKSFLYLSSINPANWKQIKTYEIMTKSRYSAKINENRSFNVLSFCTFKEPDLKAR